MFDIGRDEWTRLFYAGGVSLPAIIRRLAPRCATESHREIYYARKPGRPGVDIYALMLDRWDAKDNQNLTDFTLHSTLDDAQSGANPWQFCNYASPKDRVAFPRDSGPSGKCDWVWSSMNRKDCRVKRVRPRASARQSGYTLHA